MNHSANQITNQLQKSRFWIRFWKFGIYFNVAVFLYYGFTISPWPSAYMIRKVLNIGAIKVDKTLRKHVREGVTEINDQSYDSSDKDAVMNIYYPDLVKGSKKVLPLIVWVHGGNWVSGDKNHVTNYSKILASEGYIVAAVNYSVAPGKYYPTPVRQINNALKYLHQNAGKFHVDTARFILAGDANGAQIVSQVANIISDSKYAALLEIKPEVKRSQIRGLILFCGVYNLTDIDLNEGYGWFLKILLWSYTGVKDFQHKHFFRTASIEKYVTPDFPPCFISAGSGDPLRFQSIDFARKLTSLKVETDTLFFSPDVKPLLPLEYQFNLDIPAGKLALERELKFLSKVAADSPPK